MSTPPIDVDKLSSLVPSRTVRGFVFAVLSGLSFTFINAAGKELATELPPLYVAWGRWIAGVAFIAPYVLWTVGAAGMRTADLRLHTFRGLLHAAGTSLWYEAVVWLPLAAMAALGFTGPIFVTLGAVLFLRESVHWRRWAAVGVGFAGMLVIVRPGLVALNPGILLMLLAVPLLAGSHLVGKVVAGRDDPAVVVLWQSVVGAVCLTPLGLVLADADLAAARPVRGGRLLRDDGLRLHHPGLPAARHLRPATHHLPRHRVGRLDGRGALGQDLRHLDLRGCGDHRGSHDLHRPSRSKSGRK